MFGGSTVVVDLLFNVLPIVCGGSVFLFDYPHSFFKKASGILQSPLSVRPSRYLLLNHWTKSNHIWCVNCSHECGVQRHIFFGPAPWALGRVKRSNIIKFPFQRFLNRTLCVFSQRKDINISDGIFILPPGSCPRCGT